jgi:hypothetical protein
VQWITSSKSSAQTHYQNLFYSSCIGSANLTITAANSFNAYLDGVYIGNGTNYAIAYNFPIKVPCGSHNFTVVVYTTGETKQGLTFAINQDQSNCYNCQATGFWNENSCTCSCITTACKCTSPKLWKDYPVCGCGCPSIIFRPPIAAAEAEVTKGNGTTNSGKATAAPAPAAAADSPTLPLPPPSSDLIFFCLYPRYYSQETCSCACHYTYCPPHYYFNEQSCSCLPILT